LDTQPFLNLLTQNELAFCLKDQVEPEVRPDDFCDIPLNWPSIKKDIQLLSRKCRYLHTKGNCNVFGLHF
jgi:hypothetical protein